MMATKSVDGHREQHTVGWCSNSVGNIFYCCLVLLSEMLNNQHQCTENFTKVKEVAKVSEKETQSFYSLLACSNLCLLTVLLQGHIMRMMLSLFKPLLTWR